MTDLAGSTPAPTVRVGGTRPADHRSVPLLSEHQLDHYPEFQDFFRQVFALDADPFGPPGVLTVGARCYELTFLGRSGRRFPSGLSIAALVAHLEPLDEPAVDRDLWAILTWIIDGVGEEWTAEDLEATARIYRIAGLTADEPGPLVGPAGTGNSTAMAGCGPPGSGTGDRAACSGSAPPRPRPRSSPTS